VAEGDRGLIIEVEVVEHARKLGNDLMRIEIDIISDVRYPIICRFKAVSFDVDLLQLRDLRFVAADGFFYFFCQVFCLAQRIV